MKLRPRLLPVALALPASVFAQNAGIATPPVPSRDVSGSSAGKPAPGSTVSAKTGYTDEETARLIYLSARLGRSRDAERLANDFLATHPGNRNVLITLCSMFAEQRRVEDLQRGVKEYLKYYPDDEQGLYYLASAEYLSGHYTEAVRILRRIRKILPKNAQFPYLVDLSSNTWQDGDWRHSLEAHLELLRNERLSPELRMNIRRQIDELYRKHLDFAEAGVEFLYLETGDILRPRLIDEFRYTDRTRIGLGYNGDYVTIDEGGGLRRSHHYRQEAWARLDYTHDTLWSSHYTAGISQSGPLGKLRLDYDRPLTRSWWIEASYGERAIDSLALEALDGRQNKITLGGEQRLAETLTLSGDIYGRQVTIDGDNLGSGAGAQWRLAKNVFQNAPALIVAYRGTYEAFSRSDKAVDLSPIVDAAVPTPGLDETLVARRFHREGVEVEWSGRFGSPWLYRFFASADYDVEQGDGVYGGGFELTFRPRKSVDITGRAEYSSSATAANSASNALILGLTARIHY